MADPKFGWQKYMKTAVAVFLGWAVARADFASPWQSLGFVLAVGIIILSINFPWARLRRESEGSKSARRSLVGLAFALVALAIVAYEVIVLGRGEWFVEHALILLVVLTGLILFLKSWIAGKAARGSRNESKK
jgi:hypothetical protein